MSSEGRGGGAGVGGTWTSMNENLMALLEAVLSLAATDGSRHPPHPTVKAGGHSEDIFVDLGEEEQEEFSCSICYQVLKETMQCLNHHKFCHSCLYVWSTTGQYANRIRCPVCRCQGYYVRNNELDKKIDNKRVKCGMASCKWTGPLKHLTVHRHTTYGSGTQPARHPVQREEDTDEEEEEEEGDGGTVLGLPYLGRAPPRLPHRSQSRFNGTGLQARRLYMGAGTSEDTAYSDAFRQTAFSMINATESPQVGGGGGVLLRARRNTNHTSAETASGGDAPTQASERRPSVRQRVHPIRRSTVSRITVRHTDSNNNVATAAAGSSSPLVTDAEPAPRSPVLLPEGTLSSPRQPRPPSGPRPTHPLSRRRNLPSLPTAITTPSRTPVPSGNRGFSPPVGLVVRAPPSFPTTMANRSGGPNTLSNFHDRLQESRDRLEGLMSNFSGELDRSRQEMADFQVERERQRREQLAEVRELGRRLGQVASELRHLLGNRRLPPSDSED